LPMIDCAEQSPLDQLILQQLEQVIKI